MNMLPDQPLTDLQRFPLLTDRGRQLLLWLREHPSAPRYNFQTGDRITAPGLQRIREYEHRLQTDLRGWRSGELPEWLPPFVEECLREVPFYRRRGNSSGDFFSLPTIDRGDLGREPWAFVPDAQPLDDLIVYPTSGTTGHAVSVLSHPEVSSMYLPLLRQALAWRGVRLEGGPGRVAIVLVCAQQRTYTFASISSYLEEAGFVKINLNPAEWRDPDDRARFLDACDPEIVSGDPISFLELSKLPLQTRPKALISSAMKLLPAFRQQLENHYGCPVIDLYSTNESGPIAVATDAGHQILPPDVYVEILDGNGKPCPPSERGEVTVSGGRNPFLPLLRYRTGDWARLDFAGSVPVLMGLEGRPPVVFRSATGHSINNIDVTGALLHLALPQFSLQQAADGSLLFRVRGEDVPRAAIFQALLEVFGRDQKLSIEEIPEPEAWSGKIVQYSSALGA